MVSAGNPDMLLRRYRVLLELYGRLEELSEDVFEALGDTVRLENIQVKLKEKMAVVEEIGRESREIAVLKEDMRFSEKDKDRIRDVEQSLTSIVTRVIEREDRSRDILQRQGFKVSRR